MENNENIIQADELLTLAEVAKILKVSRKTLYAWHAQGKIRFVKIAGSILRIHRTDLAPLLAGMDTTAKA